MQQVANYPDHTLKFAMIPTMKLQKYRWSKVYESSEEELAPILAQLDIQAKRWHLESFEKADKRQLDQDSTVWCVDGAMKLSINDKTFSMQTGDACNIPMGTTVEATGGMFGCACYEAVTTPHQFTE